MLLGEVGPLMGRNGALPPSIISCDGLSIDPRAAESEVQPGAAFRCLDPGLSALRYLTPHGERL